MAARKVPIERTKALHGLVQFKLEELARPLELTRSGRRDEAVARVRSNQGKNAMDAIRALVGEGVLVEQRNVERLMTLESDARVATLRSSISLSLLAILLMVALAYVVRRDSARLRLSEERLMTTLRSIGIAAEDMPRIFEMFAQVKPTLDRKEGGLGIGLALLSRAPVQMHRGTLEGRSDGAGKGSEFTVRLPLSPVPAA